jgi:hypothetical protein
MIQAWINASVMVRRVVSLLLLALAQTMLTIALTVFTFGSNMSRWDSGAPAPIGVEIAGAVCTVLASPLLQWVAMLPLDLRPSGFPGEHFLFLANGMIWALAIAGLRGWWRRRALGHA